MAKYRKFAVAALGAAIVAADTFFGLSLGINAEQLVDYAIPILTALGVFSFANDAA